MLETMTSIELTEREKTILRNVIHQFILTANPVGSRYIAKKYGLNLSPATIRNIMADLEDSGFLNHPHTSAGRIPTDLGYRLYVDSLMDPAQLGSEEEDLINSSFESMSADTADLLKATTIILSNLTNQIACATFPQLDNAVLTKIHIVQLSSTRILVVVNISSGNVKTITLELDAEIKEKEVLIVEKLLNEKLSGLKFNEIKKSFSERLKGHPEWKRPIIRVFVESMDKIFANDSGTEKSVISGAKNIVKQPEFEDIDQFQSVIELIEDKEVIIHILDKNRLQKNDDVIISIGKENEPDWLSDYSTVTKTYSVGEATGTLGIIGPKRMQYSKTVAAVSYLAELLSKQIKI
ncbi:MAG: heat-inducible transcription repressor HrcA [Melioribacteraceae bacterium]|nr:heat-inducible transcription repressor HrcA [Melioribacteraceae bacterium]